MAERVLTFKFNTVGNPSGAKEVTDATDEATDAVVRLDEATESVGTTTSGGTTVLVADLNKAAAAARDLNEAVTDFSDAPALPFKPTEVKAATVAVEDLERAVEDLNTETKEASRPTPLGIKPSDVKPVARSINELREEVQRLENELASAPVGSASFLDLGGKVKVARTELAAAEVQARKFGAVAGRSGNAGMAVLEFSRAFEDAQYGIRGVLNNIPGLIAMLGGSAGLAGVISVVAVVGAQLWEKLSAGAKKSKEDAADYKDELAELKKFFEELGQSQLDDLQSRGRASESLLDFLKREADFAAKNASNKDALAALKERRDAELSIARERLSLIRDEARLLSEGGDKSVELAKLREASAKRILDIERGVTEQIREQELSAVRRAEAAAKEAYENAKTAKAKAESDLSGVQQERQGFADEFSAGAEFRRQLIEALQGDLAKAEAAPSSIDNGELIIALKKAIQEALTPSPKETQAQAQLSAGQPKLETAITNLATAAEKTQAAADALRTATENRSSKEDLIGTERNFEQEQRGIEQQQKAATPPPQDKALDALGTLADQLANSPELAGVAAQLKSFIADRNLSADELTKSQTLLGQFFGKIANLGATQNATIRDATVKVDDLEREVRAMRAIQGNPNP